MYVPKQFQTKDIELVKQIINKYSFALLNSNYEGKLQATHLPLILEIRKKQWYLLGHLAAANPQSQAFINASSQEVLTIFQGPHAYISPSLYTSTRNVPTWNYIAAQLHGQLRPVQNAEEQFAILTKTLEYYEPAYLKQWNELPKAYIEALQQEIVAFEIEVTAIHSSIKLSQNKTKNERATIRTTLLNSEDNTLQDLGKWMPDPFE